ncbi:MAG: MerR family transcriptional regulator [Candidatus Omnitrophota bacterium]|jgi:MerR family transcriptional regulator/heat shock protein HspR
MPIFRVTISPDEPVYIISVVSKLVDIPVWTLRQLDKAGLVCPKRQGRKSRLYCRKDIERLEYIHYLMEEKHVNISGIRVILQMNKQGKQE